MTDAAADSRKRMPAWILAVPGFWSRLKNKSPEGGLPHPRVGILQGMLAVLFIVLILQLPSPEKDISILAAAACLFLPFALMFFSRAWLMMLFLIPFLDLVSAPFELYKLPVNRLLLLISAFCFIFFQRREPGFWRKQRQSLGFAGYSLFVLANLISGIHSMNVEAVFRALTYLEPLIFYLITYDLVSRRRTGLRDVIRTLLSAGAIAAAVGAVELITGHHVRTLINVPIAPELANILRENRFGLGGRISSVLNHPVYAGLYFLVILTLFLYLSLSTKRKKRALLVIVFLFFILLMLGTGTRAVILAFIISAMTFILFNIRSKKTLIPALAVFLIVLAGIAVLFPQVPQYLRKSASMDPASHESSNIRIRVEMTGAFLNVFRQNIIFGRGPGLIQKEALERLSSQFEGYSGVENQYAVILADGGIVAGLAYLVFMICVAAQALKIRDHRGPPDVALSGVTLLALYAGYFVFVTSETCLTIAPHFVLMAVYGAIAAHYDRKRALTAVPAPPLR